MPKKIKLAFFWSTPLCNVYGGGEKVLSELLATIDLNEFDVTLIIEHPEIHEKYYSLFKNRIKVISIYDKAVGYYKKTNALGGINYKWKYYPPSGIVREVAKFFILKKKLRWIADNYDVLIDHDPFIFIKYLSKYQAEVPAKLIGWHHTDFARLKTVCEHLKRGMKNPLSIMDGLFFVSDTIKEQAVAYIKNINSTLSNNLFFTPNGIDFNRAYAMAGIDADLDENENRLIQSDYILLPARVQYSKGHDVAIEAFAAIAEKFPKLNLIFLGGFGDDADKFVERVKSLNLQDKIFFLGSRSNPYIWMKHCKLVLLCSRYEESFGLVVLESMAFNKDIVLSDLPQLKKIYGDAVNYFPVNDSIVLAEVISQLMLNQDRTTESKRYLSFIEKYSIVNSSRQFEQSIRKIL